MVCAYRNCRDNARIGSAYCSDECERYDKRETNLSEHRRIVLSAVPVRGWASSSELRALLIRKPLVKWFKITSDLEALAKKGYLEAKLLSEDKGQKKLWYWRRKL